MHSYHIPTGHPRAAAGCVEQSLPRRFTMQTQMNHSHIHAHEGSDNKMGWCTVPRAKSESNAVPLRTALWGRALQLEARQARRRLQLSTQRASYVQARNVSTQNTSTGKTQQHSQSLLLPFGGGCAGDEKCTGGGGESLGLL